MKKSILALSVLLSVAAGITIYSCRKDNNKANQVIPIVNNQNNIPGNNNHRKACDELDALSIINDESLTGSEKTSLLIEYDNLTHAVTLAVLERFNEFGLFNMELIFQVCEVSDDDLIAISKNSYFDDATLSNIIAAQLPVEQQTESRITELRPGITMNELNVLKNYDKAVSLCDLKMIYAPKSYVIYTCTGKVFKFVNPVFRSFVNHAEVNDGNAVARVKDKDKTEWTLGDKSQSSSTGSDGTTVHTISCSTPPNNKCMKIVKQASSELVIGDRELIDLINDRSLDDYEKGAELIITDVQAPVMTELINKFCTFDKYVFELIVTSNKSMSPDNINRMILNPDISDMLLTNILITNTPLKPSSVSLMAIARPNLNASYFAGYSIRSKIVSICNTNILVGDNLIKSRPDDNTTQITIENSESFNFVYHPDPVKIQIIRKKKGGAKDVWINGEQSMITTVGNTTTLKCVEPPSPKCCVVKTADPK